MKLHQLLLTAAMALLPLSAAAADYDGPYFLPGEGMYHVGLPADLKAVVTEPTLVAQAYQSRLSLVNTELASIKAGTTSYNLADRISDDGTMLDLHRFMGVGNAHDLTVRDMEGGVYHLGDNAPKKNWYATRLLAAQPDWKGHRTLPLAMYDQWDCPVTYAPDARLGAEAYNVVTVSFSNPHEGLVVREVNFPLVCAPDNDNTQELYVSIDVLDARGEEVTATFQHAVSLSEAPTVGADGENSILACRVALPGKGLIINTPFRITVSGFAGDGLHAWLPRAIDHTGIYPTHTTYGEWYGETEPLADADATADAVINAEGYFNYIGTWGWPEGKYERGEVVASADLVQIYYDPADPDWPGEYFMGEAAFPLESTFGSQDITIFEQPEWISSISYDDSQWDEYGCTQITLSATALPADLTGRSGKVVLATAEGASFYTIYIRQGGAWFDMSDLEGIHALKSDEATKNALGDEGDAWLVQEGRKTYDLGGRPATPSTRIYIRDGRTYYRP